MQKIEQKNDIKKSNIPIRCYCEFLISFRLWIYENKIVLYFIKIYTKHYRSLVISRLQLDIEHDHRTSAALPRYCLGIRHNHARQWRCARVRWLEAGDIHLFAIHLRLEHLVDIIPFTAPAYGIPANANAERWSAICVRWMEWKCIIGHCLHIRYYKQVDEPKTHDSGAEHTYSRRRRHRHGTCVRRQDN